MQNSDYQLPDIDLLAGGKPSSEKLAEICRRRDIVSGIMSDLGIGCETTGGIVGPGTMDFGITLAPGVKIQGVEQIYDKLVANKGGFGASSVGVSVPITGHPGISTFTVRIRDHFDIRREVTFMRSIMESFAWKNSMHEIPVVIGFNVAGQPLVFDLTKAPHILISGAGGTGKSVCINTLIASLLFRFRPNELKLLLIDTKRVEFGDYRDLPHLFAPIIHDETKAAGALRWIVGEIDRRFSLMREAEVRNIREYNNCRRKEEKFPYIVVVVDDLADLMMTDACEDVENSITRIAQRGRAAGIHIIVATQRPSTHIITGTIKANFPTRFCFKVLSGVDSRVVLDTVGAEKLLGMGDMLMKTPASDGLERVQGAFIPDDDIRRIAEFVSRQAKPEFSQELINEQVNYFYFSDEGKNVPQEVRFFAAASKFIHENDDDLIREAVMLIIRERKASVSYLQRRLKIGYNRAAEILDELAKRKLVSPVREDGKREILADFSQE